MLTAPSGGLDTSNSPTRIERYLVFFVMFMASTARIPPFSPVNVNDTGPFLDSLRALGYLASLGLILAFHRSWLVGMLHAKAITLLVAISVISSFWSISPGITFRQGLVLTGMTALGIYIGSRYQVTQIMTLVMATTGTIAVLSLAAVALFPGFGGIQPDGMWRGIFLSKNVLGQIMACGGLAWGLFAFSQHRSHFPALGMFALCGSLVLLSNSITSAIVLVLALAAVPLLRYASRGVGRATTLLAGLGLLVPLLVSNFDKSLAPILDEMGRDSTFTGRTDVWVLAVEAISERPILGHGHSAFWLNPVVEKGIERQLHWSPPTAHNGYLDLLLAVGIVGSVPFVVSLIASTKHALTYLRLHDGKQGGSFPAAFLLLFILYNSAESLTGVQPGLVWILYVSVSVSLALQYNDVQSQSNDYQPDLNAPRLDPDLRNSGLTESIPTPNWRTEYSSHDDQHESNEPAYTHREPTYWEGLASERVPSAKNSERDQDEYPARA